MSQRLQQPAARAVLADLLMATMNSVATWSTAAGDPAVGLAWRDAVTDRMVSNPRYRPYEQLVAEEAGELGLSYEAPGQLERAWHEMRPWPDVVALARLEVPYAFVTNCSSALADIAASRCGLRPAFTLTAEEAGLYKPSPDIYRMACERFGLAPAEVLFVAGAAYDAAGAHAAGLRAVLVERRRLTDTLPADVRRVTSLDQVVPPAV